MGLRAPVEMTTNQGIEVMDAAPEDMKNDHVVEMPVGMLELEETLAN